MDPQRARKIDLSFCAPDEDTARRLAEAMARNEMSSPLILGPADDSADRRWLVRTSVDATVDFVTARGNLVTFLLLADKFDCDYGGWGTAVVEAAERGRKPS
ncbi:MAG: ribonuclease E inhibitor RraB [Acidobacteriia bacterium]|nr:ribonuclease E inhibitor RraB [Terriglobia bacterium]